MLYNNALCVVSPNKVKTTKLKTGRVQMEGGK